MSIEETIGARNRTIRELQEALIASGEKREAAEAQVAERDAEIERLRNVESTLYAIAQAPFPLHDYCSTEQWAVACELVAAMNERSEGDE